MYETHWKLTGRPFQNTPDPAYLYRSAQHQEALMKLTYAISERMGGAMLVGDYGCGKTLLCQALLNETGPAVVPVVCNAMPDMTSLDLLRSVSRRTAAADQPALRTEVMGDALVEQIERGLRENHRDGRHTLLILDEAHMITEPRVLETLRVLLNLTGNGSPLVSLLLSGHPELAQRVTASKQLLQRIPVTASVGPLSPDEVPAYVSARLAVAGGSPDIFTADARQAIVEFSGGIPRRINTVCDVSLALGAAQDADRVDAALVAAATRKFGVAATPT